MKKKLLSLTMTIFCLSSVFSQSVPNAGFESWVDSGTYDLPDDWITFNLFASFGYSVTAFKTTDANSGSFAAKLETSSDSTAGLVRLGTINTSTFQVFPAPFGFKPSRIVFYYKGSPMPNDTSRVQATFFKWNSQTNSRDIVGQATLLVDAPVATYTMADLTIDYMGTTAIPDSMTVIAVSSIAVPAVPGSILFIDDISFEMNALGLYDAKDYTSSVFPNPAAEELTIQLEGSNATHIVILDMSGREVSTLEIKDLKSKLNVSHLKAGAYLYQLKNKDVIVSRGTFSVTK